MDGSEETRLYTLDAGGERLPCDDPQAHALWMADPGNFVILCATVPGSRWLVRSVFCGMNVGTDDDERYFETFIEPVAPKVNVIRGEDRQSILFARCERMDQVPGWHDKAIAKARTL